MFGKKWVQFIMYATRNFNFSPCIITYTFLQIAEQLSDQIAELLSGNLFSVLIAQNLITIQLLGTFFGANEIGILVLAL